MRAQTVMTSEPNDDFPPRMGKPARGMLMNAGYTQLEQPTQVSEAELLNLHGMGPKALGVLRDAPAATGRSFADPR